GGDWVRPASTDTIDVVSPHTEQVIARVPAGTPADMDRAVGAAREAFDHGPWPRLDPAERAQIVSRFADLYAKRLDVFAALVTASGKFAPALVAGCTVVFKPAPETPLDAYLLAELVQEARIPPGVVNIVAAEADSGEYLVRHPDVEKVTFTGSTAAGRRIGAICGE